MFKNEQKDFKDIETIIGPSVKVKGNFNGSGNIVIEGVLEGGLKTKKNLFIGDKAQVSANIQAKEGRIGGNVNGNIKIEGHLTIVSSAHINGDIECSSLSVERGAVLNGKCNMTNIEKSSAEPEENKNSSNLK